MDLLELLVTMWPKWAADNTMNNLDLGVFGFFFQSYSLTQLCFIVTNIIFFFFWSLRSHIFEVDSLDVKSIGLAYFETIELFCIPLWICEETLRTAY